jgi:hypothetical protein
MASSDHYRNGTPRQADLNRVDAEPVLSHTAAELRWAASSLEGQPTWRQGILETTHRNPRRYEQPATPARPASFRAICVHGYATLRTRLGRDSCECWHRLQLRQERASVNGDNLDAVESTDRDGDYSNRGVGAVPRSHACFGSHSPQRRSIRGWSVALRFGRAVVGTLHREHIDEVWLADRMD